MALLRYLLSKGLELPLQAKTPPERYSSVILLPYPLIQGVDATTGVPAFSGVRVFAVWRLAARER
jgi:hypothetical protein